MFFSVHKANPKEADQIFSAIDWRIQQLKVEEHNKSASDEKVRKN